ncbi:MAG TPA: divergent polysaccharide deacetylase family protein, partial [Thermoanaerobaculia bacterium]|nr:divergent polysaccharide deacetylase family protein [Thermoanaerobaculia bacterium]
MKRSRFRISPVTVFFVLLSLALGVVLYVKTRPSPPSPLPPVIPSPLPSPRPRASPSPRPSLAPSAVATPRGEPTVPRVAIVIDDLGNDVPAMERIARWPYEVCGAVLPVLPASGRTARQLVESGKQVLLHLPMEPRNPRMRPGPGVVLRSQTEEQITQTLES